MTYIHVRPWKLFATSGRALLYVSLSSIVMVTACSQCSRNAKEPVASALDQGESFAGERLIDYFPATCGKENGDVPRLVGRFISAPAYELELNIKDLLSDKNAASVCPPGPFLVDGTHAVDINEAKWALTAMPDYFVWYAPNNPESYEFYLTNQGGFALKSQSFKLNQEQDSLFMLLPKTKLEAGKVYYLYLKQKNGASKQTWIQPLSLAKN